MKVIKRDGIQVPFEDAKIRDAIEKAMKETRVGIDRDLSNKITDHIKAHLFQNKNDVDVEYIQDCVEIELMKSGRTEVAKKYIIYRQKRTEARLRQTEMYKIGEGIIEASNLDVIRENANLNGDSFSGKMHKFGSEYSKFYARDFLLPSELVQAMDEGYIHVHDLDHYAIGAHNCLFIPFEKLLETGFYVSDKGSVRSPQSITTAMALVAIIFQAQQNAQFGGCGASKIDFDLATYVKKSFQKHLRKAQMYFKEEIDLANEVVEMSNLKLQKLVPQSFNYAQIETKSETFQAAESMIHNLNTMASRAGSQVPFTSICFGMDTSLEGRLIIESILEASMKGLGHGETAIFPQLIWKSKKGINFYPEDPNYDLYLKAIACSSQRLFPNFVNIDAPFNLQYYDPEDPDTAVATMGCRTRVVSNRFSKPYQSGRGNLSFNTINLTKLGIEHGICSTDEKARPDAEGFIKHLKEMMDIALGGLIHRFEIQARQQAKNSDFMMQNGSWKDGEKLSPSDTVGDLLKNGSISIGFCGLAECLKALFGKHHGESQEAWDFGYQTILYMRKYCDQKSEELDMNITLFATPAESTAGKMARLLKKQYGVIPGVTDRDYITNSNHIPVYYPIEAYKKIKLEAPFHALCNAGHISYVEMDGTAKNNQVAFKKIVDYALEQNMGYFSINHPLDRCHACGYSGLIGEKCPVCSESEEQGNISRIRRITGYLVGSLDRFNSGKKAEEKDRVKHA